MDYRLYGSTESIAAIGLSVEQIDNTQIFYLQPKNKNNMRKKTILAIVALLTMLTGAKTDVQINLNNFPDLNFCLYLLR